MNTHLIQMCQIAVYIFFLCTETTRLKSRITPPGGLTMHVLACWYVRVCLSGKVGFAGGSFTQLCKTKLERGIKSFLWQTKSKQNGGKNVRCRVSEKPKQESFKNNQSMSRSSRIFQVNDCHVQTQTQSN